MSYPPLSGYGSYYDNSSNQTGHNLYGSGRPASTTTYGQQYSGDDRQSQYTSASGYDWSSQGQQAYTPNAQQSYDSWREANGQDGQYDYRRESSNYATQAAAGHTQNYYGAPSSTPVTSSMAGLNNLAYASGLDNQRSTSRTQQSSSRYSTAPASSVPNRTQSPVQHQPAFPPPQPLPQPKSYSAPDAAANATREMTLTMASRKLETASQNLALSAAQALAGAVGRRNQPAGGSQQSPSPAMPAINASQRSQSPPKAASNNQAQVRAPSAQSQRSYPQPTNSGVASPGIARAGAITQGGASQERSSTQPERSAASQSNTISNLVTTQEVTKPTSATDSMPTYIDPTQVFNPYHREHERRKKDAAEAEARKKEEQAAAAAKAKEAQVQVQKQKQKASRKPNNTAPTSKALDGPADTPADDEDEMAAEMKAMMEKMKAFRQKDPSMFQKLWEDMRKPGASGSTSTAVQSPSPQVSQPKGVPPSQQQPAAATSSAPLLDAPLTPASAGEAIGNVPSNQTPKPRGSKSLRHAANAFPYAQANGYKVVVEYNEEGLPDLGRFPAERRIRAPYVQKTTPAGTPQMPAASAGAFPKPGLANVGSPATPIGQVLGPLPAKTASGGVEWPKDKCDALAKAAVDSLKSVSANESILISTDDIHAMLEQNPSYIQLCDLLEKKGLKFHRGHFARQLLTNVPDLTTPQKAKDPPPTPRRTTPGIAPPRLSGPPSVPAMTPEGYSHPPNSYPPVPNAYPTMPVFSHPSTNQFRATGSFIPVKPEFPKPANKPKKTSLPLANPEPSPGSKEAMARKRDFSELVDLTQLSDNDDYVLSNKHRRLESPSPEPDPFEKYQLGANMQPPSNPSNVSFSSNTTGLPHGAPLKFDPIQKHSSVLRGPLPPAQPKKTILAKAVSKGEALRKSYYDPKTVARDILIAAGRHPQERPLNAHMASLLGKHIDLDSDLSTFDWDAIDPGGPLMPRVPYVDILAAPPRFHLGQRTGRHTKKVTDQSRTEAERSRLPDPEKRDNSEAPPARAPPGPQFSKLRFAKKRGRPPKSGLFSEQPKPSRLRETRGVDDAGLPEQALTPQPKANTNSAAPLPLEPLDGSSSRQKRESMESEMSAGAFFSSGKRRGRPPGSKNKQMPVSAMKKFGLPQIEVEVPTPSKEVPTFKCRWRGCKTELHNLETLRKHVAKVHCPTEEEVAESGFLCWWKKCRYLAADDEGNIAPIHAFATPEEWVGHINEDHLHPVAMKFGDGPNTSQIDSQTLALDETRYLADENGRSTTPSVSKTGNQELPQDAMTFTKAVGDEAEAAAQKAFMKAHRPGEKLGPKNTAEEMLRAMEARKAKIGPGIDRGGCTLVNDARRATFVQNPGIRRVVDADY